MIVEKRGVFIWRGGRFQSSAKASGNQPFAGAVFPDRHSVPIRHRFARTTAEDQHIDHSPVVHVHVVQWLTPAPRIIIERPCVLWAVRQIHERWFQYTGAAHR